MLDSCGWGTKKNKKMHFTKKQNNVQTFVNLHIRPIILFCRQYFLQEVFVRFYFSWKSLKEKSVRICSIDFIFSYKIIFRDNTVVRLREGKRCPFLRSLFAIIMCKLPCFQRGPPAIVMYEPAILLSKGPPTSVCKYFAFKEPPNFADFWCVICEFGGSKFSLGC